MKNTKDVRRSIEQSLADAQPVEPRPPAATAVEIPAADLRVGDKLAKLTPRGSKWVFDEKVTDIAVSRKGCYLIVNKKFRFDAAGFAVVMTR